MVHLLTFSDKSRQSVLYYPAHLPRNLIIFIHGFAGHPVNTWGDFRDTILDYPEFSTSDVIFFHYDSTRLHMSASALEFYDCLKDWITPPETIGGLVRGKTSYEKIILVAHSLGALV